MTLENSQDFIELRDRIKKSFKKWYSSVTTKDISLILSEVFLEVDRKELLSFLRQGEAEGGRSMYLLGYIRKTIFSCETRWLNRTEGTKL